MSWTRRARTSKFGAKRARYGNYVYHSRKEARYAAELDLRVKAGELKGWLRQVPIRLEVNGKHVCNYLIDFVEIAMDGTETYVEVKGLPTPEFRLKWKLFEILYPDLPKKIVW